jgi:hypothetical protein
MTSTNLNTGTWRWKDALATWSYRLPFSEDAPPTQSLCEAAGRLWSAVGRFANVASIEWSTLSHGEDARTDSGRDLDEHRVRAICSELGDVTRLEADLDLRCIGLDGVEGIIEDGAWLLLDLAWPDPDTRGQGRPELTLAVQLNVDIYATKTGAEQQDNHALAKVNAPILKAFLHRLRAELGATLVDIDSYAGRGAVDSQGWVDP